MSELKYEPQPLSIAEWPTHWDETTLRMWRDKFTHMCHDARKSEYGDERDDRIVARNIRMVNKVCDMALLGIASEKTLEAMAYKLAAARIREAAKGFTKLARAHEQEQRS